MAMTSIGLSLVKAVVAAPKRKLLLGACYPSEIPKTIRVTVRELDFDTWIHMYFSKYVGYYAEDPGNCRQGDVVLIEELPERKTRDITHKILRVIYPLGDITDPITGKKCFGSIYREDMDKEADLYGRNPRAFNYNKARPRGWQEGRKDWSHKKPFRKFHAFTDRDQTEASW